MRSRFIRVRRGWALLGSGGLALLGWLSGCVDPYEPDAISNPQSHLVVEGFINLDGVTTVRLSRTRSLSAGAASPVEAGAHVAIQDDAGTRYELAEQAPGTYASAALTLGTTHRYQLQLQTAAGRAYASDLVTGKQTPPIDSVTWRIESDAVQLYVNTHDAANATRYYRWNTEETWEFRSAYQSTIEYVNGQIQPRTENIYQCWRTEAPSTILLTATDRLGQDVVSQFPLLRFPVTSEKLRFTYSLLVRQYAESAEEFAYWDKLRKNTESLGTLFDPLPSQLTGNVHSLADPDEQVLGYVGAATVAEKRLFIGHGQLPPTVRNLTGYEDCPTPLIVRIGDRPYPFSNVFIPVYEVYLPSTNIVTGYAGSGVDCIDCRRRGTNVKPDYWP